MTTIIPEPDVNNAWRTATPGNDGWVRSARPDADDKFFMVSADGHVQEPRGVPPRADARAPTTTACPASSSTTRASSTRRPRASARPSSTGSSRSQGHEKLRNESGRTPEERIADLALDGCDAEILFPNKGLTIWATQDPQFSHADVPGLQRVGVGDASPTSTTGWRRWPASPPPRSTRRSPRSSAAPRSGSRGLCLPCKPVFGPPNVDDLNYNLARVRAAVGLHRRRRPADHVPRVDRT